MKVTDLTEGYIDPNEDEMFKQKADDTRKPRLTLRQLNKLKKIRATNQLEDVKKKDLISAMYGAPPAEDSGGF